MSFPALKEKQEKLAAKRAELKRLFDQAGPDMDLTKITDVKGTTVDKAAVIRKANDEATALGKEVDDLVSVQKAAERAKVAELGGTEQGDNPDDGHHYRSGQQYAQRKSVGEAFVESEAYKSRTGPVGPTATLDVNLKDLLMTTTGFPPEVTRTDRIVDFATRPIQVADLIPQVETTQSAVQYMEETTYTNAAAETPEAAEYPEANLAFTEQSSMVRKLAVFLPVTDEQLEDVPQMRGYVDNRLPFMVRQRLDLQILAGNGTAPNLRGILNTAGIQTQARGTDPIPDAVYKAMVNVEVVGQAMTNAVVFNPLDWQKVRLLRTADGLYIWGNPSDAGPERIWGLQVARAQALTAGSALLGDFANFAQLAVRRGIETQVSNSHSDYFRKGLQALRADMRAALVIFRPAAFSRVTGL